MIKRIVFSLKDKLHDSLDDAWLIRLFAPDIDQIRGPQQVVALVGQHHDSLFFVLTMFSQFSLVKFKLQFPWLLEFTVMTSFP